MKIQMKHEANHFNFIRLFAAFLVFYGHAFVFMGNPIHIALNHEVGLFIFFSISGYLISMSWELDPSLKRYFIKRTLRIFPALIVVIVLSIVVLGPIMTTLSLKDYFSSPILLLYLKNIFLHISFYLPGVFEHNHVPNAVNGSLWSLPVEFFMYILVAVLHREKYYIKYIVLVAFLIFATVTVLWARVASEMVVVYGTDLRQVAIVGTFFWAGAVMYHWDIKRFFSFENFVIVLLFSIFVYQWGYFYSIVSLALIPFLVLSFGFSNSQYLSFFNKADYSYGFYIYAFPVQQSIIYLKPDISIMWYLISGFIITMFFASMSWHFVEQPMIRLKPKIR